MHEQLSNKIGIQLPNAVSKVIAKPIEKINKYAYCEINLAECKFPTTVLSINLKFCS